MSLSPVNEKGDDTIYTLGGYNGFSGHMAWSAITLQSSDIAERARAYHKHGFVVVRGVLFQNISAPVGCFWVLAIDGHPVDVGCREPKVLIVDFHETWTGLAAWQQKYELVVKFADDKTIIATASGTIAFSAKVVSLQIRTAPVIHTRLVAHKELKTLPQLPNVQYWTRMYLPGVCIVLTYDAVRGWPCFACSHVSETLAEACEHARAGKADMFRRTVGGTYAPVCRPPKRHATTVPKFNFTGWHPHQLRQKLGQLNMAPRRLQCGSRFDGVARR